MTVEVALLFSFLNLLLACYTGMNNLKRNKSTDDRKDAAEMTTVIVKLETISKDTGEIKNDMKNVKNEVQEQRDRLIIAEQSVKSLHKRLDAIEGRTLREIN